MCQDFVAAIADNHWPIQAYVRTVVQRIIENVWSDHLFDKCHKSWTVFRLLVFSNTRDAAELVERDRLFGCKAMQHLVVEHDIRWKPFFIGTFLSKNA